MNVLILEDDRVSRRILESYLTKLGHHVRSAVDGVEGLRMFDQERPQIVITDWMMPEIDGPAVCREIRMRTQEARTYTYVILLTALDGRENQLAGIDAGADDFMTKPFDWELLRSRLRVAERILTLQTQVRTLEGLLPTCSFCKRIRDEADHWIQIEEYVSARSEAEFSHGVCPACMEMHYPHVRNTATQQ